MAIDLRGFDFAYQGQPLRVLGSHATSGFDFAYQGQPVPAVYASSSVSASTDLPSSAAISGRASLDVTSTATINTPNTKDLTTASAQNAPAHTDLASTATLSTGAVKDITSAAAIKTRNTKDLASAAAISTRGVKDVASTAAVIERSHTEVSSAAAVSMRKTKDLASSATIHSPARLTTVAAISIKVAGLTLPTSGAIATTRTARLDSSAAVQVGTIKSVFTTSAQKAPAHHDLTTAGAVRGGGHKDLTTAAAVAYTANNPNVLHTASAQVNAATSGSITIPATNVGSTLVLVVALFWSSGPPALTTLPHGWADSGAGQVQTPGGAASVQAFVLPNASGGVTSVALAFSKSVYASIAYYEIAPAYTVDAIDATGGVNGSTAGASVSTSTAAGVGDLILAGFLADGNGNPNVGITAEGGFVSMRTTSSGTNLLTEYTSAVSAGTATATATLIIPDQWAGVVLSIAKVAARVDLPTSGALLSPTYKSLATAAAVSGAHTTSVTTASAQQGHPFTSVTTAAVITTPTRAAVATAAAVALTRHSDVLSTATILRHAVLAFDSTAAISLTGTASLPSSAAVSTPPISLVASTAALSRTGTADLRTRASLPLFNRAVGIPSAEAVGIPGAIEPLGIPSGEAVGRPTTAPDQLVRPLGIISGEALGTPQTMIPDVTAQGIPTAEALGVPAVTGGEPGTDAQGIPTAEALGTPTVTTDAAASAADGIMSGEAFGVPTVTLDAQGGKAAGVPSLEVFGVPFVYGGALGGGPPIVAHIYDNTREPLDITGRRPEIGGVEIETADNVIIHRVADGAEFTLTFDLVATEPNAHLVVEDALVAIPALYSFMFKIRTVKDTRGTDGKLKRSATAQAPHYDLGFQAAWDINWDHTDPYTVMQFLLSNVNYHTGWYVGVVQYIQPAGPSSEALSFYGAYTGGASYTDDDYRLSYSISRQSVLSGLIQVAQTWGGYLFFHEDTHTVDLVMDWGTQSGVTLDWTDNLKNLDRTTDKKPQSQITLVEGPNGAIAGLTAAQLIGEIDSGALLPDPCESNGVRKVFNSQLSTTKEALDYLYASLLLQQQAQVSYQAGVIDLSLMPQKRDSIHLGDWVKIIDGELLVNDTVRVVQEDYNVLEPWLSTYQFSNVIPSLSQRSHSKNHENSKTPATCDSQPPVLQDGTAPDTTPNSPPPAPGPSQTPTPEHTIGFCLDDASQAKIPGLIAAFQDGIAQAQSQMADAQKAQSEQQNAASTQKQIDDLTTTPSQIANDPQNKCDPMGSLNGAAASTGANTLVSNLSAAGATSGTLAGKVAAMQGQRGALGSGDPGVVAGAAVSLIGMAADFGRTIDTALSSLDKAGTGLGAMAAASIGQSTEICGASQHAAKAQKAPPALKASVQKSLAKAKTATDSYSARIADIQNRIADMQAWLSALQSAQACVADGATDAANAAALAVSALPTTPPSETPDVPSTPTLTPPPGATDQDCLAAALQLMQLMGTQVAAIQQPLQLVHDFAAQYLDTAGQLANLDTNPTTDIGPFGSSIDDLTSRAQGDYAQVGSDAQALIGMLQQAQVIQQQATAAASVTANATDPTQGPAIDAGVTAAQDGIDLAQQVSNGVGQMVADEVPASADIDALGVYLTTLLDYGRGVCQRAAIATMSDGWQNLGAIAGLAQQLVDIETIIPAAFAQVQAAAASVGNIVAKSMADADCAQSIIGTLTSDVNQQQDINALANSSWLIDTPNIDSNPYYTGSADGGASGGPTYAQAFDNRNYGAGGGYGRQRLSVRADPPDNPQPWDVWIDTSQTIDSGTTPTPTPPPGGGFARPAPQPRHTEKVQELSDGSVVRSLRRVL